MTRTLLPAILLLPFPFCSALSSPPPPRPRGEERRREFLFCSLGPSTAAAAAAASLLLAAAVAPAARALSPAEAEARYDMYAASYDALDGGGGGGKGGSLAGALGIGEARRLTTGRATGHVLEVGAGTGLNLPHYDPARIVSLTLVDVSDGMLRRAEARAAGLENLRGVPVKSYKADATADLVELFGEGRFDTVVDTFSLCVMGQGGARRCLQQMGRVAKAEAEGGRVLLLENSRSSNPLLGLYQDATAEAAADAGGKGCVYNQNVRELILASGALDVEEEEEYAAGLFRSFVCKPRTGV